MDLICQCLGELGADASTSLLKLSSAHVVKCCNSIGRWGHVRPKSGNVDLSALDAFRVPTAKSVLTRQPYSLALLDSLRIVCFLAAFGLASPRCIRMLHSACSTAVCTCCSSPPVFALASLAVAWSSCSADWPLSLPRLTMPPSARLCHHGGNDREFT